MRVMMLGLIAAVAAPAAVPAAAEAQTPREIRREYREDVREARRERREALRDWRQARRYDWNRLEPGQRYYYADRYYRDGRYYRPRVLTRNDRIYRGYDGRYYCRRPDGTTGLIIGGAVGALLGNAIDGGRSSLLGTLIGGATGAALGREIQRGTVRCR
jgi:hypothetical protein